MFSSRQGKIFKFNIWIVCTNLGNRSKKKKITRNKHPYTKRKSWKERNLQGEEKERKLEAKWIWRGRIWRETWRRGWERWEGRQWGQMLWQHSKQKTFFSFFLRFSWTPQAAKNVSAIRPSSHAGFMTVSPPPPPPPDDDSLTIFSLPPNTPNSLLPFPQPGPIQVEVKRAPARGRKRERKRSSSTQLEYLSLLSNGWSARGEVAVAVVEVYVLAFMCFRQNPNF